MGNTPSKQTPNPKDELLAERHFDNEKAKPRRFANVDALLKIISDRIVEGFDPQQIILFGSYARGEATADSDIDLLVVFPGVQSKRQTAVAIRRVLSDVPVAKDIVVTTLAEIAEYGQMVGTVLRPALRDGEVIYERDAQH